MASSWKGLRNSWVGLRGNWEGLRCMWEGLKSKRQNNGPFPVRLPYEAAALKPQQKDVANTEMKFNMTDVLRYRPSISDT